MTIGQATQAIVWNNPSNITYGTALSAAQLNAVAQGTLTYTPAIGTILNAGTHTLSVTAAATSNYAAATTTVQIVVDKAIATIALSNLSQPFDGTAKPVTATTTPASLTGLTITYDGSATAPAAAGTYAVIASLTNANYTAANATGTLTIGKAVQSVVWANPSNIVYGTALSATQLNATAQGALTYTPALGTILDAGTYNLSVTAAATANYAATTSTVQLVVDKAIATITLSNLAQTYNGNTKIATAVTDPANLIGLSVTYNGSFVLPVNAGTYVVVGSLINKNYTADFVTQNLVINKAVATINLGNLTQNYNGSPKTVTVTTNPVNLTVVKVTYDGSTIAPTAPGSYAVVASLTNDNYSSPNVTGNLIINNLNQSINFNNLTVKTYGDAAFSLIATGGASGNPIIFTSADPTVATINGNTVTIIGAGKTVITASQAGNANYTAAADVSQELVVEKASATITLSNLSHSYDGLPKAAIASVSPLNLTDIIITYNGSQTVPVAAGTYAVVANLNNANYAGNANGSLTISKATASLTLSNLAQNYNGTSRPVTVTTNPANLPGVSITYNGSTIAPIAAGNYAIIASLNNTNYNAINVNGTLVVSSINQVITFAPLVDKLNTDPIFTLNANASSGLTLSYTSSNPAIARIVNGNQVEILGAGTVNITANQAGDNNYNAALPVIQALKINDNPVPVVTIVSDKGTSISLGETIQLTASGAATYVWTTANGIISGQNTAILTIRPTLTTTYTVTGTSQFGKTNTQSITIDVKENVEIIQGTNIMSPNGDGVNDFFIVKNLDLYPDNTITIFDRSGKTLYKVKSYKNNWDGSVNGRTLEEGTYYYTIDFGDGKTKKKGFITIVKQ